MKIDLRTKVGACVFAVMVVIAAGAGPDTASYPVVAAGFEDLDSDGVADEADNCLARPNADQLDTDADGFGNVCDPDLSNDGIINATDLGIFRSAFFSTPIAPHWNPDADFTGDNVVNAFDLATMKLFFFGPPGPAGVIRWVSEASGELNTGTLGTTLTISGPANFENGNVLASEGAFVTVAGVTDITASRDFNLWRAEGTGSVISLPNLTAGTAVTTSAVRFDIEALDGGVIDMPQLDSLLVPAGTSVRNIDILASGAGSRVQMPLLTLFQDDDLSSGLMPSITEQGSGVVDYPPSAVLVNVEVFP